MCKCKSGCVNRRCACLKNGQACTDECQCQRCQNPLNGVDTENLPMCVIQNIQAYKAHMRSQGPSKPSRGHFFLDIDLRLD